MITLEDIIGDLEHHGIKGMRWGVRRSEAQLAARSPQVSVTSAPGKGIKRTVGGAGHSPSEDAINAAAIRQKAKASTVSSLTNKDLETVIRRMNLEQQFSQLKAKSGTKSKGKKFVDDVLEKQTKNATDRFLSQLVSAQVDRAAKKVIK
jgi:hypothetical protein